MNEIKIFQNKDFGEIRTIEIDNEPWFIGKDITSILGYSNGSRDINRHVDENDKTNWRGTQTLITPLGREHFRVLTQGLKEQ